MYKQKIIYYKKPSADLIFVNLARCFTLYFVPFFLRGYRIPNRVSSYSIENASTRNTFLLFSFTYFFLRRVIQYGESLSVLHVSVSVRRRSTPQQCTFYHLRPFLPNHNGTTKQHLSFSISRSLLRERVFLIFFQVNCH